MSRDCLALLCDVIAHAQTARTQRKHCCCIVGRVCVAMDLHVTIFLTNMSTSKHKMIKQ
jgi:hypothetical protein